MVCCVVFINNDIEKKKNGDPLKQSCVSLEGGGGGEIG